MGFTTKLAEFQESLFKKIQNKDSISASNIYTLKFNLYVKLAYYLSPSNLVIRQLCLIDLISNNTKNKPKILKLINKIGKQTLWLEGYSYWLYTKEILDFYEKFFNLLDIQSFIFSMDISFLRTAYKFEGVLYPAPFGDLRHIPLEQHLQDDTKLINTIFYKPILKQTNHPEIKYTILSCPLGFNTHVPIKNQTISITNNYFFPNLFWYESYDKKYKNKLSELIDTLRIERILSLF